MRRWQILLNIIFEIAVFFGGALLLLFCVPKFLGFFWPFVVSWLLALMAAPLCRFLEHHIRLTKKWASATIIVMVLAVLIGLGYFIITRLGRELFSLLSDAPVYYGYVQNAINDLSARLTELVVPVAPDFGNQIQTVFNDFLSQAGHLVNEIAPKSVEMMGSAAANLTNGLIGILVMFLSAYFFIADRDKIVGTVYRMMPEDMKDTVLDIKNKLMSALGGFVIAQFKIMAIIFLILLCGLIILRNPYALLLALLIAFLDLLPILGTGTVLIPWALLLLLRGQFRQGIILLVLYVVCLLSRQLLQPKIIGDSVGLDTLTTLVLIYTGYKLGGMKGIIFALLVGVIVITLFKLGLFDNKINRVNDLVYEYRHYKEIN